MKKYMIGSVVCLILTITQSVQATDVRDETLQQLLFASGLQSQMEEIPRGIISGLNQPTSQGAQIPEQVMTRLYQAINESFSADELVAVVRQRLSQTLTEVQAQRLFNWYQSEIGKKITQAEIDASSPAAYLQMNSMAEQLFSDERRVIMAQTVAQLADSVDMVMELQSKTSVAIFAAVSLGLRPDETPDITAFLEQMASEEEVMRDNLEQFVILTLLYSYREIPLVELGEYLKFLEQKDARKFYAEVNASLKQGLNRAIEKMAESLFIRFSKKA